MARRCVFTKSLQIVWLLLVRLSLERAFVTADMGRIVEYCPAETPIPNPQPGQPPIPYPRPRDADEAGGTGEEEITGKRCFNMSIRGYLSHTTAHISVLKGNGSDFCKNVKVLGVEFLALGFVHGADRTQRQPIGYFHRSSNATNNSCVLSQTPNPSRHHYHSNFDPSQKIVEYTECAITPGYLTDILSNTSSTGFRIYGPNGIRGGKFGEQEGVGCAIWQYTPGALEYPVELEQADTLYVEFIAEIDAEYTSPSGKKERIFRSVGKRSVIDRPMFYPLPELKCKVEPPSTSTTTESSTNNTNITTTTVRPTPPPPMFELCPGPATCPELLMYIFEPEITLYTSFYESISDACMCYSNNLLHDLTVKKYKYGGLHYGLPSSSSAPARMDSVFKDCLQFYYDSDTNCIIFTMDQCLTNSSITSITIEQINIFALGTKSSTSSEARPFGKWEPLTSLGNCGNIVNDRGVKPRAEFYSVIQPIGCPLNGLSSSDFGMIPPTVPEMARVFLYPHMTIRDTAVPEIQSLAVGIRLDTSGNYFFIDSKDRVDFLNFILEAYAKVEFEGSPAAPSKFQVLSMKTPIMSVEYVEQRNGSVDSVLISRISPQPPPQTHDFPYFQLNKTRHDQYHYNSGKTCPHIEPPKPSAPPSPVVAPENACNCFTPLRSDNPVPISLDDFLTDVNSQAPRKPLTKECFVFGHHQDRAFQCDSGKDANLAKVLLYFGLTCTGPDALEIRDVVFQGINQAGYPIGIWQDIDFKAQANLCGTRLKAHNKNQDTIGDGWIVRVFKPISQFPCPDVDHHGYHDTKEARESTFYESELPFILYFNQNVTDMANSTENFGVCSWWRYRNPYKHVVGQEKNFYFDFQFTATAHILHRPTLKEYVVALHSSNKAGFNTKTCQADVITASTDPAHDLNIYMDKTYYDTKVDQAVHDCVVPITFLDSFETGMCGYFVGNSSNGTETHRIEIMSFDEEDPIRVQISTLQQCLRLSVIQYKRTKKSYEVYVRLYFVDTPDCEDFWIYEVAVQAINNYGLPMGSWYTEVYNDRNSPCKTANSQGEADIELHNCTFSKNHAPYYKTNTSEVHALRFINRWKDDHYRELCARWKFPSSYAAENRGDDTAFPIDFQFYGQSQCYSKVLDMMITSPMYSTTKIEFDVDGKFETQVPKLPIEYIKDFNNYLVPDFDYSNTILPYPEPPVYLSHMCRFFHPSTSATNKRIDLDDPEDPRALPFIDAGCFSFRAYPGNEPLSLHVTFRQESEAPTCRLEKSVHFAVTAYNELGFPIGRPAPFVSWSYYENPKVGKDDHRYCENDDVIVEPDSIVHQDDDYCPFYPDHSRNLTEFTMNEFYLQEVTPLRLPNMLAFGTDRRYPPQHVCFHWSYDPQTSGLKRAPEYIQIYLEFFVPKSDDNLIVGDRFVIRSKKFKMSYTPGDKPQMDRIHPKNCHDETDRYNYLTAIPVPRDGWERKHRYNIYPDKEVYRRCLHDYKTYATCNAKLLERKIKTRPNPVVIIPGYLGGNGDERYNYDHFKSTKIIYDGCLTSKLCFSPLQDRTGLAPDEPDCIIAADCELVWALGKQPTNGKDAHLPDPGDDHVVLELYDMSESLHENEMWEFDCIARSIAWMALGISIDREMGDDFVTECIRGTGMDAIDIYHSWNLVTEKYLDGRFQRHDNTRLVGHKNARLIMKRVENQTMYCMFYLKKYFMVTNPHTSVDVSYDLAGEQYCILIAFGEKLKYRNGKEGEVIGISNHIEGTHRGYAPCREHMDLTMRLVVRGPSIAHFIISAIATDSSSVGEGSPSRTQVWLLQDHGVLMTIAYMGFLTTSVFTARYYKTSLTNIFRGLEVWVWIHATGCVSGALLVVVGFILTIPGHAGWSTPLESPFHIYIGYLAALFTLGNVFIGYYLRRTNIFYRKSKWYYMIHIVGGHFACVGGLWVIVLTTHVETAFVSCATGHTALAFTVLYFVIHIAMSFNRLWVEKLVGAKKIKTSLLNPMVVLTQRAPGTDWMEEDPRATTVRKNILVIFYLIAWGFAISTAVLIKTSDHSCALNEIQDLAWVARHGSVPRPEDSETNY